MDSKLNSPIGSQRHSKRGFTLTEMVAVLAVIAILVTFAVPTLSDLAQGSKIQQAGDVLSSHLTQAQQEAIKLGVPVEVRFLKFKDANGAFDDEKYYGYQFFTVEEDVATRKQVTKPLNQVYYLPETTCITENSEYNTLFELLPAATRYNEKLEIDRAEGEVSYVSFQFRASGGTNLPQDHKKIPAITVTETVKDPDDTGELPANFVTLVIDQFNGTVQRYQPQ